MKGLTWGFKCLPLSCFQNALALCNEREREDKVQWVCNEREDKVQWVCNEREDKVQWVNFKQTNSTYCIGH